jgi:hypothetical protein
MELDIYYALGREESQVLEEERIILGAPKNGRRKVSALLSKLILISYLCELDDLNISH